MNTFGRHQSGTCSCCDLSRRSFIGGAAALGLAGALFAKPSAAAPTATLIDTHHHCFPPAYQKAWLEWEEARKVRFGLDQFKTLEDVGLSAAELQSIGSGNAERLIPQLRS